MILCIRFQNIGLEECICIVCCIVNAVVLFYILYKDTSGP